METGSEMLIWPVASLGLVLPGAATDGVTHFFPEKKNCRHFCSSLSISLISLGCHPLKGVTPDLFHLSDLVSPLFFVNSGHIFFIRVSLPWKTSPGAVHPPPCGATEYGATKPEIDIVKEFSPKILQLYII